MLRFIDYQPHVKLQSPFWKNAIKCTDEKTVQIIPLELIMKFLFSQISDDFKALHWFKSQFYRTKPSTVMIAHRMLVYILDWGKGNVVFCQ